VRSTSLVNQDWRGLEVVDSELVFFLEDRFIGRGPVTLDGTDTAASALEARTEALSIVGLAFLAVQGLASKVGVARDSETRTMASAVILKVVGGDELLHELADFSLHASSIFGHGERPVVTSGTGSCLQLGVLVESMLQIPQQVSRPGNTSVEDVTFVGTFVFVIHGQAGAYACGGGSSAVASSQQRSGLSRRHARSHDGGRKGGVCLKVLSDSLVLQSVHRNKASKILNALVDVVASSALNKVVRFSSTLSLGLLGLESRRVFHLCRQ
jgi:hypothetical protein